MDSVEITGQEIENIYTLGSAYDNGYIIGVRTANMTMRMDIKELLKLLNGVTFVGVKKRKYTWLKIKEVKCTPA